MKNAALHTMLIAISCCLACAGSSARDTQATFIDMPENVEVALLEQRVAVLRAELDTIAPQAPERAETLVELALELEFLIYARSQGAETPSPLFAPEPPDYTPVIAVYEQVLTEHPNQRSSVMASLLVGGQLLIESGRREGGIGYLERLIAEYPDTPSSAEAGLVLGELAFGEGRLLEAQTHLSQASGATDRAIAEPADYILGWIDVNLDEYEAAYTRFDDLASHSSAPDLAAAAERDLLFVLAHLDGGVDRALVRFAGSPALLSELLALCLELAHPGVPTLTEHLLSSYPDHALVPQWCEQGALHAQQAGQAFEQSQCPAR